MKRIIIISIFSFLFFSITSIGFADDPTSTSTPPPSPTIDTTITPTPTSSQNDQSAQNALKDKIKDLEDKISQTKQTENSLSSQIDFMDNQIKLTQYRINATQEQINETTLDIDSAGKRIKKLEVSLSDVTKVLLLRIRETYQTDEEDPLRLFLASSNLKDFLMRQNYLRIVQEHDKELLYNTQQAKVDYANQKSLLEGKKKKIVSLQAQLENYNKELDGEKDSKQKLLTETQGSEENYQKILAETKAQLASFSKFVTSQGGASLLSNQTVCDDWGCYYNQRDSQWGDNSLNGTGYTLADSGCLMTSVAMVYTHYGHKDVTPQSVNSNSSNFGGIPPALLKFNNISVNGISSSRVSASIDSELAGGNPVIVGISYDGGQWPDHFVVLVSGSGGNYMMNDPYTPNGHNISFTGHYSVGSIVEVDKVVF